VAGVVSRFHTEGVIGFHDLRTRRSGSVKFIELHLEVTSEQTFLSAHDLTERVIAAIESEIPRSRVQIHCDPEGGR
jgi:ferrous-iron efflux pump FieF